MELDMDKLNEAMARVQEQRLAALSSDPPAVTLETTDPAELPEPPTILTTNPDVHSVIDPVQEAVTDPTEQTEPTEQAPATISIDGRDFPLEDIQGLIQFNDLLATNPALFAHIQEAVRSPLTQPYNPNVQQIPLEDKPAPSPVPKFEVPEDLDLDDPSTKFMVDQFQSIQDRYNDLASQNSQFTKYLEDQQAQYINASIATGKAQFQQANPSLTNQDMLLLEEEINRTQLLAGLRSTNPNLDLAAATREAFERSMWAVPEIRDRILHAKEIISLEEKREEQQRQAKLAALSGTSSSTPRVPPPATPADRKQQMINDLAQAMGQRTNN